AAERRGAAELARQQAQLRGEVVLPPFTAPSGGCVGADVTGYPNGLIPREALCPLWGAEWHALRADAAAAFNAMSQEYARTFSRPICVTDSYRSYEMQVDVRRRKPNMTAVPGTSNHGWGLAVDLCDGIENFGTATHAWMQLNAPRFGWYHPGWAAAGGSRPEPWHWEYGG
ncbi:MAG: M15 family metallopeptidase, partial [Actinomycetota bacterium]|nr:M15 family metallopeptidase [Actinomycetota bacterium]